MGDVLATNPSSSNPSIVYRVLKGGDGVIYCDCPGWKMRKDCKHLKAYHASNGSQPVVTPALMGVSVKKTSGGQNKTVGQTLWTPSASGPMLQGKVDPGIFATDEFQSQAWYQGCGSEIATDKPEELLTELKKLNSTGEWFAEPKLDGIFIAIFSDGKKNRFWSRNSLEKQYGLADMPLPAGTLLIGELGAGSEHALERRAQMGHDFVDVHGILVADYDSVIDGNEADRRVVLDAFHSSLPKKLREHFLLVPRWDTDWVSEWDAQHEGLVLKLKKGGSYIGRGTKPANWRKAKKWFEADMVIMDIRYSEAETKKDKGMTKDILCGQYVNGVLKGLTWVGSMTDDWSKKFASDFSTYKGQVMVVKHNCQFKSGALRHASMLDLRDDKDARDCIFKTK
jgi:hypothetical protein